MRIIFTFLLFLSIKTAFAQTTIVDTSSVPPVLDSATLARQQQMSDSLARFFIVPPKPDRENQFLDSLIKAKLYTGYAFLDVHNQTVQAKVQPGKMRSSKNVWLLGIMLGLLLYTALLNRFSNKSIGDIVQSFYNNRIMAQFSKDDHLDSWSFVFLFLLFGATLGLLFYQIIAFYNQGYTDDGWQLYLVLSFAAIIFFILKIFVLRILGLIFNVRNLVKEYISVLYLTYFNITFISLPLAIAFGLISDIYKPLLLLVFGVLILTVLLWQYVRSSINLLSIYRFSKVYLFIYLCAIEFCPVLIIIKALKL